MKISLRQSLALLLPVWLAGCAAGPDYARPEVKVPAQYKEQQGWKPAEPRDAVGSGEWWKIYGDAKLDQLMPQIEVGNQQLRAAEAQLRQARALAQQARAGFFPTVNAGVSVDRSKGGGSGPREDLVTAHTLSLDASWEPDLWGRVRRSVEGSEAGVEASAADVVSARLSLQAELAQDYFSLRVLDAQRELYERSVAGYERTLKVTENRYRAGVVTRADVVQAQTQLKAAQAQLIDLGVQRAQLEHAIAVLVGKAPAEFSLERAPFTLRAPEIAAGVPSQLLERRPDIAAAERRVAAANAQIGVAESAWFPALTLSATGGFQSTTLAQWITAPNQFWSLGAQLAERLFDGGLRTGQTEQAKAQYDAGVANYRQTVLGALQEVEDDLAAVHLLDEEMQVQDEAVKAARETVRILNNQYRAGTVSYTEVFNVEATALTLERTSLTLTGRRLNATALLVKALGGSW